MSESIQAMFRQQMAGIQIPVPAPAPAPVGLVSSGSARGVICHHCQQPGHIKPRCPQLQSQGGRSQTSKSSASMQGLQGVCNYCKQPGHFKRECPHLQNRAQSGAGLQATPAQSTVAQLGFRVPQAPQPVAPVSLYPGKNPTPTTSGHQSAQ
ncbi:uncharacterized protein LOC132313920 [Cornus florida]|uniref:uncharacterized protein LOC132313920 n=1 Tax=Cornus florida TaxID=4283 RepID=UPI0028A08371|nr:uncharacterized protein LOC132313920 [Cornus florida]